MSSIQLILTIFLTIVPNFYRVFSPVNGEDSIGLKLEQFKSISNALDFTGKVAVVTGAGPGLSGETVKLFSYLGAQVTVTDIKPEFVSKAAQECLQLSPKKIKPCEVVADLSNSSDIQRIVNKTIECFGKIDILVNAAAIVIPALVTDKNYLNVYKKTMAINLEGPLQLIREAEPYLKQTNGSIVNIASEVAGVPIKTHSAYSIAKAGLVQLTKVLSVELGPNIRVNAISPGAIYNTEIGTTVQNSYYNYIRSNTPLGRYAYGIDYAKVVVFMASPLSQWINGQNILTNGGHHGDMNYKDIHTPSGTVKP